MPEFKDNSEACGLKDEDDHLCAPNQCRVDNGYTKHCKKCLCATCTRSDCHKETFDTFTVVCFGCVHACKVEFLSAEAEMPDGCFMSDGDDDAVKWEYP